MHATGLSTSDGVPLSFLKLKVRAFYIHKSLCTHQRERSVMIVVVSC